VLILIPVRNETNEFENLCENAPHPSCGHPLPIGSIGWEEGRGEGHSSQFESNLELVTAELQIGTTVKSYLRGEHLNRTF
jgi:hypothetical protein